MNKKVKIAFRTTEFERIQLDAKARKVKLTLSEFCRKAVFDKEIKYYDGLIEVSYELNKIGTNINQIAAAANQGRDVLVAIYPIKARLYEQFDKIEVVLKKGEADGNSQTD